MDKIPFKMATKGRALEFKVNRKAWTIDGLPLRGGRLDAHWVTPGGGRMLAFGTPGLVAGSRLLHAVANRTRLVVTFTAADGRQASRATSKGRLKIAEELLIWIVSLPA